MDYKKLFLMLFVVGMFTIVSAETFGYGRTEETPIDYNITINETNNYNNYTYNGTTLTLDDISDVNAAAPADGESLVWDSGLARWIADTVISRWIVSTVNGYFYNDSDTIYFNESKLNNTIDSRATAISTDFEVFINGSAYNNVEYNITKGDVDNVEFTIVPGKKFIFGDTFT